MGWQRPTQSACNARGRFDGAKKQGEWRRSGDMRRPHWRRARVPERNCPESVNTVLTMKTMMYDSNGDVTVPSALAYDLCSRMMAENCAETSAQLHLF